MASIEAQELGARTGEVLRRVREGGETIDLTEAGTVVARVVPVAPADQPRAKNQPVDPAARREAMRAWLREVDELAHELAKDWPKGVSAQDVIDDVRRER